MKFVTKKLWLLFFLLLSQNILPVLAQPDLEYNKKGVIRENGDKTWQNDEYITLYFDVDQNQTFKVKLSTDQGELIIFFMQGSGVKRLQSAIVDTIFGTPADQIDGIWFYGVIDSSHPFYTEYITPENISGSIMIATYSINNPSTMNYVLESNISPVTSNTDPLVVIGLSIFVIVFILAIPISISYMRKKKGSKSLEQISQRYNQFINQPNTQNQNQFRSELLQGTCLYCGTTGNTMNFCSNCGKELKK